MAADREINELLEDMMYGPLESLPSILYGYDRLGAGGQQIVRAMTERLREPGRTERLQIQERKRFGPFELVIVSASWKPNWSAYGFLPLILVRYDSRLQVVGYVLPFNPVMAILTAEERKYLLPMGSCWMDWLEAYKKGQER